MNRRDFITNSLLVPATAAALEAEQATQGSTSEGVSLRDKFFGCIAGLHVGSALKGPCEGWRWQDIEAKYGTIDRMIGYQDYRNGWDREPGTTEDGVERSKMMSTAIIEKKDRVSAEDVRKIWVRDMKPEAAGMISEVIEGVLLAMAKSGIPASHLGMYADYATGTNCVARACHPIALINACDIQGAVDDVFEIGQLYQPSNSRGLQWAAMMGIAIASATKPHATVDSVIADVLKGHTHYCSPAPSHWSITEEIERGLELTKNCKDFRETRVAFDAVYSGYGNPYATCYANETVTKAICVFHMCKGNTKEAMIAGVNMGRDTDCLAATCAGISGALTGAGSIPEEWLRQVDYATTKMPVTNNRRTVKQTAEGLYEAYRARTSKMRNFVEGAPKA